LIYESQPTAVAPGQTALFRQEAVRFQEQYRAWGDVAVLQPFSTKLLAWLLALATALSCGFLGLAEYARKETVRGYLTPAEGTSRIFLPHNGTISAVLVKDGQAVEQGQPLLVVDTAQISIDGSDVSSAVLAALAAQREHLKTQLRAQEEQSVSERQRLTALISSAETELSELVSQIRAQEQRLRLARELADTAGQLKAKGHMAEPEVKRREAAVFEQHQALAALQQQWTARESKLTDTRYSLQQLPALMGDKIQAIRNELSAVDQKIAELSGRRAYVVRAPVSGRVSTVQATVGQNADTQRLQMEIIPKEPKLQAELLVPSRAIGFVEPGQAIRIMYEAFPYQHFGTYSGHVVRVSQTMVKGSEITGPVATAEPVYRVSAAIDAVQIETKTKHIPLQPDMLLRADIILEKRPLIRWLIDPLLSARF
jgi:membrane fusion protein